MQDILIACVDGLKGFPDAIETIYPKTQIQLCIVHMIRNSLRYVPWKHRKGVARDLKQVYSAPTAEAAPAAPGTGPSNLPLQRTTFIGREHDLSVAGELLAASRQRAGRRDGERDQEDDPGRKDVSRRQGKQAAENKWHAGSWWLKQSAHNEDELKALDANLSFDSSWDQKTGYRTKQALVYPIVYQKYLMAYQD